jgi:hypothetical protein
MTAVSASVLQYIFMINCSFGIIHPVHEEVVRPSRFGAGGRVLANCARIFDLFCVLFLFFREQE